MLNGALIRIDQKMLLKMLDFEGGEIRGVRLQSEYLVSPDIEVALIHPDLPEIRAGQIAITICPTFTRTYAEHGGLVKVERTHPAKKWCPAHGYPVPCAKCGYPN